MIGLYFETMSFLEKYYYDTVIGLRSLCFDSLQTSNIYECMCLYYYSRARAGLTHAVARSTAS